MTWLDLLEQWPLIESDLQDSGVDVGDDALMSARSWRWLKTRVTGLLSGDTRTQRYFAAQAKTPQEASG